MLSSYLALQNSTKRIDAGRQIALNASLNYEVQNFLEKKKQIFFVLEIHTGIFV